MVKTIAIFCGGWIAGSLALLVIGHALVALVLLVAVLAGWGSFSIDLGPLNFLEYTSRSGSVIWAIESGPGLFLLPPIVGALIGFLASVCLPLFVFPKRLPNSQR